MQGVLKRTLQRLTLVKARQTRKAPTVLVRAFLTAVASKAGFGGGYGPPRRFLHPINLLSLETKAAPRRFHGGQAVLLCRFYGSLDLHTDLRNLTP